MIKKSLLFILITLSFNAVSQVREQYVAPKLVVVINIDELQTDHFYALKHKFGKNGFNRLLNEGAFYKHANYGTFSAYHGSKVTTMLAGSYPSSHGIVSDKWYSQYSKEQQTAFQFSGDNNKTRPDSGVIFNRKIHGTTIVDELQLFNRNKSKVATIGVSPHHIAFNSGQNGKHMYWFDRTTGQIVTQATDTVPDWVDKFNDLGFPAKYIARQWGPVTDIRSYHEYLGQEDPEIRHFLYNLKGNNGYLPYEKFSGSPDMNVILRDFSVSLMFNEEFGKDDYTDFLSINFTCKPKVITNSDDSYLNAEQEDMLIRLDKEIASVLKVIETQVGTEHVLVMLSSTPTQRYSPNRLIDQGLEVGSFNGKKTSALLNLYLMALHGQGKWVVGYHDRQFYLNQELIKEEELDFAVIRKEASDFLLDVAGIDKTVSGSLMRLNNYTKGLFNDMQNSYSYNRSGDILISLLPGWSDVSEGSNTNEYINYNIKGPLIFWGSNIHQKTISRTIEMIDVAATLSTLMHIPLSESNIGEPLKEVVLDE